jgi:hypothetical protein
LQYFIADSDHVYLWPDDQGLIAATRQQGQWQLNPSSVEQRLQSVLKEENVASVPALLQGLEQNANSSQTNSGLLPLKAVLAIQKTDAGPQLVLIRDHEVRYAFASSSDGKLNDLQLAMEAVNKIGRGTAIAIRSALKIPKENADFWGAIVPVLSTLPPPGIPVLIHGTQHGVLWLEGPAGSEMATRAWSVARTSSDINRDASKQTDFPPPQSGPKQTNFVSSQPPHSQQISTWLLIALACIAFIALLLGGLWGVKRVRSRLNASDTTPLTAGATTTIDSLPPGPVEEKPAMAAPSKGGATPIGAAGQSPPPKPEDKKEDKKPDWQVQLIAATQQISTFAGSIPGLITALKPVPELVMALKDQNRRVADTSQDSRIAACIRQVYPQLPVEDRKTYPKPNDDQLNSWLTGLPVLLASLRQQLSDLQEVRKNNGTLQEQWTTFQRHLATAQQNLKTTQSELTTALSNLARVQSQRDELAVNEIALRNQISELQQAQVKLEESHDKQISKLEINHKEAMRHADEKYEGMLTQKLAAASSSFESNTAQLQRDLETSQRQAERAGTALKNLTDETQFIEELFRNLRFGQANLAARHNSAISSGVALLIDHSLTHLALAFNQRNLALVSVPTLSQDQAHTVLERYERPAIVMLLNLSRICDQFANEIGFKQARKLIRESRPDLAQSARALQLTDERHDEQALFQSVVKTLREQGNLDVAPFYYAVTENGLVKAAG